MAEEDEFSQWGDQADRVRQQVRIDTADWPECRGCGKKLSPVIKAMDDIPYCTQCIKDGKSSSERPERGEI